MEGGAGKRNVGFLFTEIALLEAGGAEAVAGGHLIFLSGQRRFRYLNSCCRNNKKELERRKQRAFFRLCLA